MSRHRPAVSLMLLLTVAGCAAPPKQPDAPVDLAALKAAVQVKEQEWSAAFLAENAAAVAALYSEDAAQIQPSGDWVRGRDGITKSMQAQFDTIVVKTREDITEEVIPAGNYTVEVGHYSWQGTAKDGKSPRSGAGRYMVVWRKDADGVWRLLRDIGAEASPPKKP